MKSLQNTTTKPTDSATYDRVAFVESEDKVYVINAVPQSEEGGNGSIE